MLTDGQLEEHALRMGHSAKMASRYRFPSLRQPAAARRE